jgi:hypothetical protein
MDYGIYEVLKTARNCSLHKLKGRRQPPEKLV